MPIKYSLQVGDLIVYYDTRPRVYLVSGFNYTRDLIYCYLDGNKDMAALGEFKAIDILIQQGTWKLYPVAKEKE